MSGACPGSGVRGGAVHRRLLGLAAAAPMLPGLAAAQEQGYQGGDVVSLGGLLQMATALALVLILIAGIAWFAKRFGRFQGAATDRLRLMGGIHLGQRERIILVEAEDVRLVVGVSPGCIRTLHVLPAGESRDVSETRSSSGGDSFIGRFNQELKKRLQT